LHQRFSPWPVANHSERQSRFDLDGLTARVVLHAIGSEAFVVDFSGRVEFLGGGPKADAFGKYLENSEAVLLPSMVVYEVYKKMLREQTLDLAERFLSHAFGLHERELAFDISLAASAARVSLAANLPMADAFIYAAAQAHQAELITSDAHFSGLPGVTLI
jgi:predicted nucleic acid-binding protein